MSVKVSILLAKASTDNFLEIPLPGNKHIPEPMNWLRG